MYWKLFQILAMCLPITHCDCMKKPNWTNLSNRDKCQKLLEVAIERGPQVIGQLQYNLPGYGYTIPIDQGMISINEGDRTLITIPKPIIPLEEHFFNRR